MTEDTQQEIEFGTSTEAFMGAFEFQVRMVKQRIDDLQILLQQMRQDSIFCESEKGAVEKTIQRYDQMHTQMSMTLAAKRELYEKHVCGLQSTMRRRRQFLEKFDGLLTSESEVAQTIVRHHAELEGKLQVGMHSIQQIPPQFEDTIQELMTPLLAAHSDKVEGVSNAQTELGPPQLIKEEHEDEEALKDSGLLTEWV